MLSADVIDSDPVLRLSPTALQSVGPIGTLATTGMVSASPMPTITPYASGPLASSSPKSSSLAMTPGGGAALGGAQQMSGNTPQDAVFELAGASDAIPSFDGGLSPAQFIRLQPLSAEELRAVVLAVPAIGQLDTNLLALVAELSQTGSLRARRPGDWSVPVIHQNAGATGSDYYQAGQGAAGSAGSSDPTYSAWDPTTWGGAYEQTASMPTLNPIAGPAVTQVVDQTAPPGGYGGGLMDDLAGWFTPSADQTVPAWDTPNPYDPTQQNSPVPQPAPGGGGGGGTTPGEPLPSTNTALAPASAIKTSTIAIGVAALAGVGLAIYLAKKKRKRAA